MEVASEGGAQDNGGRQNPTGTDGRHALKRLAALLGRMEAQAWLMSGSQTPIERADVRPHHGSAEQEDL
jgi:hypothetical protein